MSHISRLTMKICIPIQAKTQKEALKMLEKAKCKADMAEIWLDHIKDLDIFELLKNKSMPVICVCKKLSDKGKFKGGYAEMADVLMEAAKCGADYIDIPFSMTNDQTPMTNYGRSKIIISNHNFKKTPSIKKMMEMAKDMKSRGADIVKISVMAKSLNDTLSVILLAQQLQVVKIPHILIAMGKKGILSRVLTPFLGGTIMFAPLSKQNSSASGQLTVKELRGAWGLIKE